MNLQYFFTYKDKLPPGVGFDLFGLEHIITLAIGISVVFFICIKYYRADPDTRRKTDRIIGSRLFIAYFIIYYCAKLISIGKPDPNEAPLHLCRIIGLLCILHSFKTYTWLEQVLYTMGIPGAMSALLFADWNMYPAFSFWPILANIFHFGILLYILLQLISHRITPHLRYVWTVAVFIGIILPPIYLYNKKFGTNFLFINYPSPGSPLEMFEQKLGNPGYILPFVIVTFAIIFIMELMAEGVIRYKSKRK